MNGRTRISILLLVLLVVLFTTSGCAEATKRTLPTAGPTIRPAPPETLTVLVGYELTDLFRVLLISLVVSLALLVAANIVVYTMRSRVRGAANIPPIPRLVLQAALLFIPIFLIQSLLASAIVVPAGQVGVRLRHGATQNSILEPGLHWITPYVEQVALLSTREFTYITTSHVDTASEDFVDYKVGARTCDGVEAEIPYTIKFRMMPESAPELFAEYGSIAAVQERVVKAVSRQVVREVPTQFSSIALYVSSAIVEDPELVTDSYLRQFLTEIPCGEPSTGFDTLNEEMRHELAGEFERAGLMLTFFGVRQPDLGEFGARLDGIRIASKDAEIARIEDSQAEAKAEAEAAAAVARARADGNVAIEEAKASAETQRLLAESQAEADRLRAESEAEVAAIRAESEAAVAAIQAESDAERVRIQAEAEAARNEMLAESLTPELVSLLLQQAMYARWDGKMPMFGELDGATPFIEIPAQLITGSGESAVVP
jgi:regulator of protease activity HflC (stomatin/prohibitin superfamily)